MRTTNEEVHHEIAKLAVAIQTDNETFNRAYERARNLFRIKQQRETAEFMNLYHYVPTCKAEVWDPNMFGGWGGYEGETQFIEDIDQEEDA